LGFLRQYPDLARELYWKRASQPIEAAELSWKLDASRLAECRIFWPTSYPWKPAAKWYEQIRQGLERFVRVDRRHIPQPSGAVLAIEVMDNGRTVPVLIDIADSPEIGQVDPSMAHLYFKLQHDEDGYDYENVIPGGYLPNSPDIHFYLPRLRTESDQRSALFDVYGRFGTGFASKVRTKALQSLSEQRQFHFEGGPKRIRYSRFLSEVSRSSVAIDLPGNGPFCFRLVDYLGVGSCVVARKHGTILHAPLENMVHLVYVEDDLSNLVSVCEDLLAEPALRRDLVSASRDFFDRFLHVDQLAAYYLNRILESLE